METEYVIEIIAKSTPLLVKKCSSCSNDRFYCSDKFRINAQKKNIDVWLIYRCVKCDNTYNMTILSRTKPELVNKSLLTKFLDNDTATAWEYAFSSDTAQKNSVSFDFDGIEYEMIHHNVSLQKIISASNEVVRLRIKSRYRLNLKLAAIIKECLGVSTSQLNRIAEMEAISTSSTKPLKKQRVKDDDVIELCRAKLIETLF